jgi:hypothetical protein
MAYNRYNLRPTLTLPYNTRPKSIYIGIDGFPNHYYKRNIFQVASLLVLALALPYISVQTFRWLDRLPVWEQRLSSKRREKVAFDFMLKTLAEKERDIMEEFSDY